MADAILEVKDLAVAYGKVEAVHGAHLRVGAGQIVTVIGPNGAGKSSMLNAIMGHCRTTAPAVGASRISVTRCRRWASKPAWPAACAWFRKSGSCSRR